MTRPAHDPDVLDCDCFGCHIRSVQWSPAATPSRRNSVPGKRLDNAWERGVPTDNRGMPLLDNTLNPVRQKKYAANRTTIESKRREMLNAPAPSTP